MTFGKWVILGALSLTAVSAQALSDTHSDATRANINAATENGGSAHGKVHDNAKHSKTGIEIPEPSNIFMLALGVAGLVAGRYASRRSRDR